jgi:hypothetical protein
MKFNVFGSKSSRDRDVLVYIESLPSLEECKSLSKRMDSEISGLYPDGKEVNTNLAVVTDGAISEVFKGTVDEVNNSVFVTYCDHEQKFPLLISLKTLRAARISLSLYSRTDYRPQVKSALKGNLVDKLDVLKLVDFSCRTEFGKKGSDADVYKNVAFQLGQVLGLKQGIELYSKEAISSLFADLTSALNRTQLQPADFASLGRRKAEFIGYAEDLLPTMTKLVE